MFQKCDVTYGGYKICDKARQGGGGVLKNGIFCVTSFLNGPFQTKCELVNAKDEVINNLKTILELRKADSPGET